MNKKQKKVLIRIIITAVLLVALKLLIEFSVLPETGIPTLCMYLSIQGNNTRQTV